MKLLFDQNISFRLVKKINNGLPEAKQVRELGLENATDKELWDFSKENGYTIVTFDSDFFDFSTMYGFPPKVVWLRTGNISTDHLAKFLSERMEHIQTFVDSSSFGCLQMIID